MGDGPAFYYIFIIAMVVLSAFFSATETAFSSVSQIKLKNKIANGNKKAEKTLKIAQDYDRTLSAILIGNNIVNIAAASVGTLVFTLQFGESGAVISTVVITVLILIFGEVLPKSVAKENPEKVAIGVSGMLKALIVLFTPVIFLFVSLKKIVRKITGGSADNPVVTEQELKVLIEESENQGVLEQQESELVMSALDFDETTVREVLTPRVDVTAVDANSSAEQVKNLFIEQGYSRLPVYSGSIDTIVGVIHNKDFFRSYISDKNVELKSIMQHVIFVPATMKISQLLKEFQKQKTHMAIVSDQYGGTIGIVTLEDIIEELVGEIWDESDEVEYDIIKLSENKYKVSGDMNPLDFFEKINFDYKKSGYNYNVSSISGWVLEKFERIPQVNESFSFDSLDIKVTEIEKNRIISVEVTNNQPCDNPQ